MVQWPGPRSSADTGEGGVKDSPFRGIETREAVRVAALFAVLAVLAFFNVVFLGQSVTPGNNANPLAPAYNAGNYGPHYRPYDDFRMRAVHPYANIHDVESSWWQGEPAMELLQRALWRGEFPFWDPWTGGGAPAMANMTPAFSSRRRCSSHWRGIRHG